MEQSYQPQGLETRWYTHWENIDAFTSKNDGEAFTILLPPPNVTGTLHMGHAFQHTLMDALIRYHRMQGFDTLWQVGADHAGIATEMVVSRNMAREGKGETRDSLGRDGFIDKIWEWKAISGDTIERQMRRMGASADWSRSVFTMDDMPSKAVIETFVKLHEEGLIYRGKRLVNWDPVLKTAISDLEVENHEEQGHLWSIAYPLSDGSDKLVVATTRPETMLGDTAVMVHPEDERYQHLIGQTVTLPLTGREIPIIADDYVDRDFGTGVVKVTPAHDFNDYQVGVRHDLPMINIFTETAHVTDDMPEAYRGLERFAARKQVLNDLEAAGLLVETKKHTLQVPRGDRTGQIIEPYLTDQWFVSMADIGKRALQLVEDGQVSFVPPNWINTYRHWMQNIQDWCISRQLWWGHRIPAWYDADGNIYVGRTLAEAQAKAGDGVALTQDDDVLETWFSSALWPFSTLGWPDEAAMAERGFDQYLPSSVLVTGFDIIFFWVARMIMMTDKMVDQIPFKHVYMTGLVRDRHGNKMSKSKGNVLDPIDIIDGIDLPALVEKRTSTLMQPEMAAKVTKATENEFPEGIAAYGADALRFTFASLATHGRDIKFDLSRCEGYKNFCNKLWNAAKFVMMNLPDEPLDMHSGKGTGIVERYILDRCADMIRDVEKHMAEYRFDLVAQTLYEFTWDEYCDWFVELAKPVFQGEDGDAKHSMRITAAAILEAQLLALHPLIPFVTEEIWQHLCAKLGRDVADTSISLQNYPKAEHYFIDDAEASADIAWLKRAIGEIRRVRSESGIAPSKKIEIQLSGGTETDKRRVEALQPQIASLARLESLTWGDAQAEQLDAVLMIDELRLVLKLGDLIDVGAEKERLSKDLKRIQGEIKKCQGKLGNDNFVANAPEAVVQQERERLEDWQKQLANVEAELARLGG